MELCKIYGAVRCVASKGWNRLNLIYTWYIYGKKKRILNFIVYGVLKKHNSRHAGLFVFNFVILINFLLNFTTNSSASYVTILKIIKDVLLKPLIQTRASIMRKICTLIKLIVCTCKGNTTFLTLQSKWGY